MAFNKPCLICGTLSKATLCPTHQAAKEKARNTPERQARKAALYNSSYRTLAKQVRANATQCHICKGGYIPHDPFEADHLIPGDPYSPLAPAHRSCNQSRGNKAL